MPKSYNQNLLFQHKLGVLIANADHLTAVLATASTGQSAVATAHDKEPNVLPLSTRNESSGWFSMLPVMNTATSAKVVAPNEVTYPDCSF